MGHLNDQLMASLQKLVMDNLPYDRNDRDVVQELTAMSPSDLLIRWLNWTRRVLPQVPRRVFISKEFTENPILRQQSADIDALIEDIESGENLTKYLSRDVIKYGYVSISKPKHQRRRAMDLMLNAWGMHHLHFSKDVESDGFVKREDAIIFAVFRPDRAFLIDIMTHEDWAKEHVVRVMVDNWPDEGLVYKIENTIGLPRPVNDQERQKLRNGFVNSMLEINGCVYMPAGGMAATGVGLDAVRQADLMIEKVEAFAVLYEENPDQIIGRVSLNETIWPEEPSFVVEFRPDAYGITELKTQVFIRLGP